MIFHATSYKIIGETLLLLPTSLLLLIGIADLVSSDISGLQHFVELIPFASFAYLCWYQPRTAGMILATAAALLAVAYFLFFTRTSAIARLINDILLFVPLIIAGVLFFTSSETKDWKDE